MGKKKIPVARACPVCGYDILELDGITVNAAWSPMVPAERGGHYAIAMDGGWLIGMRKPREGEEPVEYGHWIHDHHYRERT